MWNKDQKIDWLLALGLMLFFLGLYWYTLVPSVYSGDSGEITGAIYELGVPHATGFPLYLLLAKGFSSLIFFAPNFAYAVNLFSAVTAALTLLVMYLVFRIILDIYTDTPINTKRFLAVITVCLLGLSSTLWDHAIAAKVYSLSALFMAAEFLMLFCFLKFRANKYLYLLAGLLGFSFGTHMTAILFVPVLIVFVILYRKKFVFTRNSIIIFSLLFVTPVLWYLYLPISSSARPYINFGDFSSWQGFYNYITQKDYAFKIASRDSTSYAMAAVEIVRIHFLEFTLLGFGLFYLGAQMAFEKVRKLFYLVAVLIIANIILMLSYGNADDLFILYRYFLPSYLAMSIFILFGLFYLWEKVRRLNPKYQIIVVTILVVSQIFLLGSHFYHNNQRHNNIVENYSQNVLRSVSDDAILFTLGDSVSGPLWYLHLTGQTSPNIRIVEYSLLTRDWYVKNLQTLYPEIIPSDLIQTSLTDRFQNIINYNLGRQSIYATFNNDEPASEQSYIFLPHGLIYKIIKSDQSVSFEDFKKTNTDLWSQYNLAGLRDSTFYKESMVQGLVDQYNKAHNNIAHYYGLLGNESEAIAELEESLTYNSESFISLYNLSLVYQKIGDIETSRAFISRARTVNRKYFLANSTSDQKMKQFIDEAIAYGKNGEHDKVIELLEQAKLIYPESEGISLNLGVAYATTKEFTKAVSEFERNITINPNDTIGHLNLATIYFNELRLPDQALTHFQAVLDLEPNHPQKEQIIGAIGFIVKNQISNIK